MIAQGLLGAIGGGSQAASKLGDEERKEETERKRMEMLKRLEIEGYRAKADIDIANIPKKGAAETDVKAAAEEKLRPGIIETARGKAAVETEAQGERKEQELNLKYKFMDEEAEAAGKKAAAEGAAKQPFELAKIAAQGQNSILVAKTTAEEAAKRHWVADKEGYYTDMNGERVTRKVHIEGRGVERVPVMAPDLKVTGPDWRAKEELDSLNKRIEAAERNGDDATVRRLLAEKDKMLGKSPGAAPTNRPPISSFQK